MPFIHAVKGDACRKDSIIEISVKSPEGRNYTTNFRVTEKDLELIQMLIQRNGLPFLLPEG